MEELNDVDPKDLENLLMFMDTIEDKEDEDVDYGLIMDAFGLDLKELEREMEEYIPKMEVQYTKSNVDSVDPKYAYESDSGFDLYSVEDKWIRPFDRVLIPTGLHMDIPEGYEIQVRSKSGLALKQGLMVLNSPGTVDQGYTGELQVILFNTTNQKVKIEKGQKIAQAVFAPVVSGKWITLINSDSIKDKDRSDNGFGSTGLK